MRILLDSPPPEGGSESLFGPARAELSDALRRLEAARRDEDAKGVLLWVGPMGGSWGRVDDLVDRVQAVRDAGKPVHCHFTVADNLAYAFMTRACDRISMTPAGDLDLVGVAAHLFFVRSLLSNVGLHADLLQIGRFKGAADPFTMDEPSDAVREDIGALLDDLSAWLVASIAEGRHLEPARVQELIDDGPYDAWTAFQRGLVDDVGFDDEAREHARQAAGADRVRRVRVAGQPDEVGLTDILGALSGEGPTEAPEGDRIALVYLVGTITDGEESGGDEGSRAGPFVAAMRRFAHDDEVKAVVLRIDSPGGSALASDRMWHAVRGVVAHKPVIVSVGDMAASGGYYVASAGTRVLVQEASIIGSIGVVGGKVDASELAGRIGVHVEVIPRGRHAAYSSPIAPFTDEERALLERSMTHTYERFLQRVEVGRGLTREQLAPHAEGRVMLGSRAVEAGLANEVGSLWDALALARHDGGLPEDAPIERWPPRKTFLDVIAEGMGGREPGAATMASIDDAAAALGPLGDSALSFRLFLGRERVVLAMPFVLHIQ